ncbi:MAG TPA: ABC-type transport auxiliary lipoprotein family protein [Polyangiaceae bacterium]|nr:ABC-type transport auxiliary lipoprotein family protein [Polyangiaceae bacterium]
MKRFAALAGLVFAVAVQGCALLTKNAPLDPRYFTPEPASDRGGASTAPTELSVRLGPVTSGSEIRQNLVVRNAGHELSFSDEDRWTEKPEAYLRRALSHELFERRGVRRVVSGPSLTVEVELVAFEEVVQPAGNVARVVATLVLHDERVVREEKTLTVEVPVDRAKEKEHAEDTVRALSRALARIVSGIADEVIRTPEAPLGAGEVSAS